MTISMRAQDPPAVAAKTATASQPDWLTGTALMTGSAASNQIGAATAALEFPVLGPAGVVAVRQWVAGAVLLTAVRPRYASFTRPQWQPVLALALECGPEQSTLGERAAREGRLLSIKAWIEDRLYDPTLTLDKVAMRNQISLRQLHYLFELCDTTPSDWIWRRRLARRRVRLQLRGSQCERGHRQKRLCGPDGDQQRHSESCQFQRTGRDRGAAQRAGAGLGPRAAYTGY